MANTGRYKIDYYFDIIAEEYRGIFDNPWTYSGCNAKLKLTFKAESAKDGTTRWVVIPENGVVYRTLSAAVRSVLGTRKAHPSYKHCYTLDVDGKPFSFDTLRDQALNIREKPAARFGRKQSKKSVIEKHATGKRVIGKRTRGEQAAHLEKLALAIEESEAASVAKEPLKEVPLFELPEPACFREEPPAAEPPRVLEEPPAAEPPRKRARATRPFNLPPPLGHNPPAMEFAQYQPAPVSEPAYTNAYNDNIARLAQMQAHAWATFAAAVKPGTPPIPYPSLRPPQPLQPYVPAPQRPFPQREPFYPEWRDPQGTIYNWDGY